MDEFVIGLIIFLLVFLSSKSNHLFPKEPSFLKLSKTESPITSNMFAELDEDAEELNDDKDVELYWLLGELPLELTFTMVDDNGDVPLIMRDPN